MTSILWLPIAILLLAFAYSWSSVLAAKQANDGRLYEVKQLTFSGSHSFPRFSPDKRYIYFSGNGGNYGKTCDDVYRLDLNYIDSKSDILRISRVSPGLGHSTHVSMSTTSPNTLVYESTFETAFANPEEDILTSPFCPKTRCTGDTKPAECNEYHYVEHFSGTNSYRTSEFGNPAYRLADLDANAYQSSPDQRGKFVVTVKKCSKTTGSGDTAVVTQGTCLYSNTKDLIGTPTIGYYDFPSFTNTSAADSILFYTNRAYQAGESSEFVFKTDNSGIYMNTFVKGELKTPNTLFVKPEANKAKLYPRAFQKANTVIYTQIDNNGKGTLYQAFSPEGTPVPMSDPTFSTMQADVNAQGNQIVFVRQPDGKKDYQVFLASLTEEERVLGPFEKKPAAKEVHELEYFSVESHIILEGRIGRARLGEFSSDLFFEYNPDKTEKLKCKQVYHIDTGINDYSTLRLISTGLSDVDGMDFYEHEQNRKNSKSIIYASNFMRTQYGNKANLPVHGCQLVGCAAVAASKSKSKKSTELRDFCSKTNRTKYLGSEFELYQVNTYGNFEQRLTNNDVYDGEPTISPSGKLAFTQVRQDRVDIVMRVLDAPVKDDPVTSSRMPIGFYGGAAFSADDKKVVFHGTRPSNEGESVQKFKDMLNDHKIVDITVSEIYIITLGESGFKQLTFDGKFNQNPTFTPDGRVIFERTDEHDQHSLWQIDVDGHNLIKLTEESIYNGWKLSFARSHENSTVFIGDKHTDKDNTTWANQINFARYKPRYLPPRPPTQQPTEPPHDRPTDKPHDNPTKTPENEPTKKHAKSTETPQEATTVAPQPTKKSTPDGAQSIGVGSLPLMILTYWILRNGF